jgi:integrase
VNDRLMYGPTKTHASRSVPVPAFLRTELALLMEGKGREDLLFTSPMGHGLRLANWRQRVFDPAVKRAGLTELTPHGLRHTAASLAVSAGANVKAVQRMLGHKDAGMTLNTYADLFDEELDSVAERLDGAVSELLTDQGLTRVAISLVGVRP